ncbi:MAG: fumarylacetoacetate hydrolase family protein [Saprospiraceae bacterium]|jgi:2-keto-4-pentenoate hydratase/2-oxohepta-3-ene-1,7-dioic acid hydratase in catechol pathway|nr:fumarylacetoacetate hydrolase family protein [Saprospiraceae bacterium]
MRLFRFGIFENEKPGVRLTDGTRIDVSGFGEDYNEHFFANNGLVRLSAWLAINKTQCPKVPDNIRIGSCVCRPSKIVCIGLNYTGHATESGMLLPPEPVVFLKSTSALCGPNDDLIIPKNSVKTDWEVELALVIGKRASYISEDQSPDYIAGYTIHNDYSERAFQMERGGQWVKGKSNDTFAPVGPYLVTKDEIVNPQNLRLWLKVNGDVVQDSDTNDMAFGVNYIVSYLSQFMTLLPGDIISTGTPGGVGFGMKPPRYLKPGDIVELGVQSLGQQKQHTVAYQE